EAFAEREGSSCCGLWPA
ncbi:unnamed protein product, partial [Diplocarpon coronariae]